MLSIVICTVGLTQGGRLCLPVCDVNGRALLQQFWTKYWHCLYTTHHHSLVAPARCQQNLWIQYWTHNVVLHTVLLVFLCWWLTHFTSWQHLMHAVFQTKLQKQPNIFMLKWYTNHLHWKVIEVLVLLCKEAKEYNKIEKHFKSQKVAAPTFNCLIVTILELHFEK